MKFCVIGLGRFGYAVATTLANRGMQVLAIDSEQHIVDSIRDQVFQAICMEVVDEDSLAYLELEEMDAIIVAIGEHFDQSILITAILKQHLKKSRIIVRSISDMHKKILLRIGADLIVLPEQETGTLLAQNLSLRFEALASISSHFSISRVTAPKKFVGKALATIHESYHVQCIGTVVNGEPEPVAADYIVQVGDVLLLAGNNKDLEKIAKM